MFLFLGTRDIIFRLFYDYDIIMLHYSYSKLGDIASCIAISSPFSFIIHGAIRFFGYGLFEGREKLKAYFLIMLYE